MIAYYNGDSFIGSEINTALLEELSPSKTYPGMYLNNQGVPTSTETEGANVNEYDYSDAKYIYASGFSPSGTNVAVAYVGSEDELLGTENFGASIGFTKEKLTIPEGTIKIRVMGNNSKGENQPFAYSSEVGDFFAGETISNYKLTIPSNANKCRIAGNSDYQVPVLTKLAERKYLKDEVLRIDKVLSFEGEIPPSTTYTGMYLNSNGIPTETMTEGSMVKEYSYVSGDMYASGFSPSSPNVAVAYFNKDDLLLGTQSFGQSIGYVKELLVIPNGTNKVRIMGNNNKGVVNQPYAYLKSKATGIDDVLSPDSVNPIANKTLYEQLTVGGLVQLSPVSSVSGKTVSSTDGSNEYAIDDPSKTYYASGRIGVTEGTCMIAYYNGDSFIGCEIVSEGTGNTYQDYKLTIPSNANKCRIAGNSDYQVPELKVVAERKYLKDEVESLAKDMLKTQYGVVDFSVVDEFGNAIVEFYNGHVRTKNFDSGNMGEIRKVNILSIGNSYSRDCLSHVPYLLKNISTNVEVCIGLLYYGGCSLQQHYDFITNASAVYEYCQFNPETSKWSSIVTGKDIGYALQQKNWDIILLQQKSSDSIDYTTCQPYLNDIISWLCDMLGYNFRTGWIETHAYATGYSGLSSLGISSDEMALKSAETAKSVLDKTVVDFILPYGIAIQNARHTVLDSYANHLTYEGTHLNEGIATLTAGYVIAECLADRLGLQKSILGDPLRPTSTWQTEQNIPQPHGSVLGITDDNCLLGQRCALMAIKNPYEITDLD